LTKVVAFALGCAASVVFASPVAAQSSPVMLELEGDFATPITAPAIDRFLPGGGASAAALFAPYRFMLTSLRARAIVLGDGAAPADQHLVDPGVGALYTIVAALRLRTDGINQAHAEPEATGFWAEIAMGAGFTGPLVRPTFEVGLGYAFDTGATDAGHLDVGPVLRFVHVLQTDERGIDGNSTFLLTAGLQFILFDAPEPVSTERVVHTRTGDGGMRREGTDGDHDGVDDLDDRCPTEPEDVDGHQDSDGCIDPDDDGDGILDVNDACRNDAEDVDGFEDTDGCPDIDNDNDGFSDSIDACPDQPEDEDGFQDTDGCPDPDNDSDGIPDTSDACPNEPETINEIDDTDGCPDQGAFALVDDHITLDLETLFGHSPAEVHDTAQAALHGIVELAQQHPEWTFSVGGHGNEDRREAANVALSLRRAQRVMEALVADGLDASRVTAQGFGSSQPRMEGHTEEAHLANCRVEIVIDRHAGGSS
jgi:outer membrane protein OmpA-like peptidoglycan-associated protein